MTLAEIKNNPMFGDESRRTCSDLRQHFLKLQRSWLKSTPTSDLEEIGRRAIIYAEIIDAMEELMEKPLTPGKQRLPPKRLHNVNHPNLNTK
jgi:hypothetical protein